MDYYSTLGIPKTATQEEIKRAYRKMAAKHHPDRGGNTAEFQKVEEAYRTLSDESKRQQYDNPQSMGGDAFGFNFGGGPGFNPFEDIFRQFNQPRQRVYTVNIFVSLEQVSRGDTEAIQIQTPAGPKTFQIKIPKGIEDGQRINYENLMSDGVLQIQFRIHRHPKYERRGLDLYSTIEVSMFDLILGATMEFKTIYNSTLSVNIPPNTKPGSSLRLANHGLEAQNNKGDQYLLISVVIPDKISAQLLNALHVERTINPS
jgi:curved DNA-binding protein